MNDHPPHALERQMPALHAWSRGQALCMAAALSACAWRHAAWPAGAGALLTFLGLFLVGRGSFTPRGRFGYANAVTSLRLLAVILLSVLAAEFPARGIVALVGAVLALDLLDGWLARRFEEASAFGAHFDMETDALLVLVVTLRLWLSSGFSAWVLFPGALRYLYVGWLWLRPGSGREAPRSLFGRAAFALLMLGLCIGLALPGAWGASAVWLGTLAVSGSFARSCYYSSSLS